jgi:hypothetical protein
MTPRPLRYTLASCLLLSFVVPTVAFADPGETVHMDGSVKFQMSSVAMSMPATKYSKDLCVPKQTKHDLSDVQGMLQHSQDKRHNCTVSNFKIEGTSASLHYSCTGDAQLEGDGTFSVKPSGGSQGAVHTSGNVHGQPVTVDFSYDFTPSGAACEYSPPKTTP